MHAGNIKEMFPYGKVRLSTSFLFEFHLLRGLDKFVIILKSPSRQNLAYIELGHNSFKKLVWMNPGSRHPTVLAGAPASRYKTAKKPLTLKYID